MFSRSLVFPKSHKTPFKSCLHSSLSKSFSTKENQLIRLQNGVRVTSLERSSDVATIGVTIEAGSRHQNENNGVANFTQKLSLKRPSLGSELRQFGGELRSYTSRDRTVFVVRCLEGDVEKGVQVLGNIIKNSGQTADHAVFDEVRTQVLSEMDSILTNPEEVVMDHLHSIAFQKSSLGFSVLGSEESLKTLTGQHLQSFVQSNYTGPKVLVSGVGVGQERFVEAVKNSPLVELQPSSSRETQKQEYLGSLVSARDDTLPEVYVAYGVRAPGFSHEKVLVCKILEALFGNWEPSFGVAKNSTSQLCETMSMEGAASKIKGFYSGFHEVGLLGVYGVTSPHNIEDFSVEVLTEFVRLSKASQFDIRRAKEKVKADILANFNGQLSAWDTISQHTLSQARPVSLTELITRVDILSEAEVRSVATEILYDVDPVIAAYGPTLFLPDYNRMRSWIYWNRF